MTFLQKSFLSLCVVDAGVTGFMRHQTWSGLDIFLFIGFVLAAMWNTAELWMQE